MKGQKSFRHTDPNRMYSRDPERDKRIIRLAGQGYGKRQITRMVGCSRSTVDKVYLMHGLDASSNSRQKLTDDDIQKRLGNDWKYISGYTKYNGKLIVECVRCGKQKEVNRRSVLYNSLGECECKRIERKAEKEAEKILAFWDELQKPRPLKRDVVVSFCLTCGKPFVKEGRSPCCSATCKRKARRKKEAAKNDKRLREMSLSNIEDITLEGLIIRDKNTCWLCGKPCDVNDSYWEGSTFFAGNNYPSIDHVLPLAKGGTHTWDNVRLAHRICNSIKSDKLIEQMPPLFGQGFPE